MLNEIILCAICSSGLFLFLFRGRLDDQKLINEKGGLSAKPIHLVASRLISFIWLLAFIVLLSGHTSIPVFNSVKPSPLAIVLLLTTVILTMLVAFYSGGVSSTHQHADQSLATSVLFSYIITRFLYLSAYEIFLRGCVLSILTEMFGVWTSIVINTLLYGVLHAFAPRKEILASVLFGPVLCLLTIQFQALWPAIALHLLVAVFYEGKQLNYHFKSLKQTV